jgi:ABC-2 type transport system ATP-binding protein
MPGPAIVANGLSVVHRGRGAGEAVRDVDLDLGPGTSTALVGPNGAGKSTLLRVIAGYLLPRTGAIRVGGASPRRYRRRRGVGYLPENPAPPPGWTVFEWILTSYRMRGFKARHARHETAATIGSLGLERRRRDRVDRLSWGTVRSVGLAFALAGEPSLALLDEPFAGLDAEAAQRLNSVLRGLSSQGTTVIVSMHDTRAASRIVDRVIAMESGRIVGDAATERPVDISDEGR